MLGDNIVALRKKMGLSQQELAERIHVVRQTVSKWEKNLSVPDASALVALADALDVTTAALLGEKEPEKDVQPDIAAALSRINDQLAIQNRRRSRIWKAIVWIAAGMAALQLLVLILGWTYSVDGAAFEQHHTVTANEQTVEITE